MKRNKGFLIRTEKRLNLNVVENSAVILYDYYRYFFFDCRTIFANCFLVMVRNVIAYPFPDENDPSS